MTPPDLIRAAELPPGFGVRRQSAAATALWISGEGLWCSGVLRLQNPKRRGASLPGALQNACAAFPCLVVAHFCP